MIKIICIGKNKDSALKSLEKEYSKRCSSFTKLSIVEVKDEPTIHMDRENEIQRITQLEADRVLKQIKDDDFVVLLDLHGDMLDSIQFSKKLDQWQSQGKHIVFVIAGSCGPHQMLVNRAQFRWKLSDLTFTHLMTRVLLLEQIYRGFSILHQRNYHK